LLFDTFCVEKLYDENLILNHVDQRSTHSNSCNSYTCSSPEIIHLSDDGISASNGDLTTVPHCSACGLDRLAWQKISV